MDTLHMHTVPLVSPHSWYKYTHKHTHAWSFFTADVNLDVRPVVSLGCVIRLNALSLFSPTLVTFCRFPLFVSFSFASFFSVSLALFYFLLPPAFLILIPLSHSLSPSSLFWDIDRDAMLARVNVIVCPCVSVCVCMRVLVCVGAHILSSVLFLLLFRPIIPDTLSHDYHKLYFKYYKYRNQLNSKILFWIYTITQYTQAQIRLQHSVIL